MDYMSANLSWALNHESGYHKRTGFLVRGVDVQYLSLSNVTKGHDDVQVARGWQADNAWAGRRPSFTSSNSANRVWKAN